MPIRSGNKNTQVLFFKDLIIKILEFFKLKIQTEFTNILKLPKFWQMAITYENCNFLQTMILNAFIFF